MRLIKMLGLAMVASVIAMAFLGASSAMAVLDNEVVICGENVELCPAAKILPQGAVIKTATTKIPIFLGVINQKCNVMELGGKITSAGGMGVKTLLVAVSTLTLTGACTPCATPHAKATELHIEMVDATEWLVKMLNSLLELLCPFGIKCIFAASEIDMKALNIAEGTLIEAVKQLVSEEVGNEKVFCGTKAEWDLHYVIKGHWLSTFKL